MSLDLVAAMRVFTTVVEAGSFAAAADRLEMSRAMVTRHVALLESHLRVRLLHRTTRRLSLTEAGAAYHPRALQVLALAQEAADVVTQHARTPSGTLRIASSVGFGEHHLQQAITAFLKQHAEVKVDLALAERVVDLVEEGFDLSVRVAVAIEPGFVARRLARVRTVCCAAPTYLKARGTPRSPQDLRGHNCMIYAHKDWRSEWHFRRGGEQQIVPIVGNFRCSGGDTLVKAAIEGLGIALEPEFLVCDALADGRLVPVLKSWQPPELSAFAVYPERHHLPLKVRAFIDFLVQAFEPPPWEAWLQASARHRR
jgi:DNA-binding transcriptional LysR family regulator